MYFLFFVVLVEHFLYHDSIIAKEMDSEKAIPSKLVSLCLDFALLCIIFFIRHVSSLGILWEPLVANPITLTTS